MLHGDSHAGNIFRTSDGLGLIDWQVIQHGAWSLDVAYHINAVLPVEVAEKEERRLLNDYLARMRATGVDMPSDEQGWTQYQEGVAYGLFMWAITRRGRSADHPPLHRPARQGGDAARHVPAAGDCLIRQAAHFISGAVTSQPHPRNGSGRC